MTTHAFGVLLEEVREQMKVLAEGQRVIVGRLDKLQFNFDALDERLRRVEMAVLALGADVRELKTDVAQLKVDVRRIESKLDGKVDRAAHDALERRVLELERRVGLRAD
jgi:predicted  nucleic acid-binding Zn-ribbon protein